MSPKKSKAEKDRAEKNRSGKDRIVLIFDIWKPEIEEIEKHQIATLFSAVDSF